MPAVLQELENPEAAPLHDILDNARRLTPVKTAIVDPYDALSLGGSIAAAERGLIEPLLVGDPARIREEALRCDISLQHVELCEARAGAESRAAARLAARGDVKILVKGALHSDALLHAVLSEPALCAGGRLSHVVVTELPDRTSPVILSDGAVNIFPDVDTKVQIIHNAVDIARKLGINTPRVALLAAVETIAAAMTATVEAAAIAQMAQRGEFPGTLVDGPLALDDALSPAAAATKAIHSPVAGRADILISPDLEAGNILFKAFDVLLRARFGAIVAGAAIPIVFTSRADSIESRVISCAVARLLIEER